MILEYNAFAIVPGLELTLNVDQDDYVDESGAVAGIRASVLPQHIMPFPEDDGITVGPGTATYLQLLPVCTTIHTVPMLIISYP